MLLSPPVPCLEHPTPLRVYVEDWSPELMLWKRSSIYKGDEKKQGKEYIHRGNNNDMQE